jgi:glyoxylase-like metal-dependent hydrolase (beta-lactamase superfamily II)
MVGELPAQVGDHLFWVPGENGARFPYCHSYLFEDGNRIVVFDPKCGESQLNKALAGIGHEIGDITEIICTHFHLDHSTNNMPLKEKTGAGIWVHELDAPALQSVERFVERYGIEDAGTRIKWQDTLETLGVRPQDIDHVIREGDIVPGGFQTIHTPGHSPGHCCFYKEGVLIAGDLDCTTPWVGNATSNVNDFLASIERLQSMEISSLLPGHGVPIFENIPAALEAYRQKITRLEMHLLEMLSSETLTVDEIVQRVDRMKRERNTNNTGYNIPSRSPIAAHLIYISTRNYLLHLESLHQVKIVLKSGKEAWKSSQG